MAFKEFQCVCTHIHSSKVQASQLQSSAIRWVTHACGMRASTVHRNHLQHCPMSHHARRCVQPIFGLYVLHTSIMSFNE